MFKKTWYLYVIILIVGIVLCIPAWLTDRVGMCLGLGTGAITSLIVSLLVEAGNAVRQRERDRQAFERLQSEFKDACKRLAYDIPVDYIARDPVYDTPISKSFSCWVDTLAKRDVNHLVRILETFIQYGRRLEDEGRLLYHNECFSEAFLKKVNGVTRVAGMIKDNAKISVALGSSLGDLVELLGMKICELYPAFSEYFSGEITAVMDEGFRIAISFEPQRAA